jgi:hypothetical protein
LYTGGAGDDFGGYPCSHNLVEERAAASLVHWGRFPVTGSGWMEA